MSERNAKLAASGSANALNRALGHLTAALCEIDEAHAQAMTMGSRLDADEEKALYKALSDALAGKITDSIIALRDRRAARAGFSFEEARARTPMRFIWTDEDEEGIRLLKQGTGVLPEPKPPRREG
jgi:hypothetical protein